MSSAFLDTSVLIQFLVGEKGDLTERATALFENLPAHNESVHISTTVIFETVYVLNGTYGVPRSIVAEKLSQLISLPGLVLPDAAEVLDAFNLWVEQSPLSFADCYHLVLAMSLGLSRIYSFDKKMNRYPGVERVEP